ncbi:MAG: cellulase family glycosylhydrolase [Acidimicrobiales bacterium]|jgi:endo-1,4-beta-mannosidase
MWSHYDAKVVREELKVLFEHGCNVTRSFCFWPDFVPEPEHLDQAVLERFSDFLDAHVEVGLQTIPTFIVGHMSGQNWDPAWRAGRDLYRDVWFVSQQAWFAGEISRRFGTHPSIAGWLLSNEMPLYGGAGTAEEIAAWARILIQAVRASGATQPVSIGDGAWGVEVTGRDNGYSLRALAPMVDFIGPHVYTMLDDQVRQSLAAAFVCELSGSFDKPVILEEFGVSSDFASGENAANYYRQVLYTTLLAGSRGWIAWNNCDFDDLRNEDPYRHHAHELHFGLTDSNGEPKPQLVELKSFAAKLAEIAPKGWERPAGDTAIVVPEHLERVLPFTLQEYRDDIRDDLMQCYVAAKEADLRVCMLRERDGLPAVARLYLVPSAKLITAPGAERLAVLADGGATVYASYFAGSTNRQRGPWMFGLEEMFGVRHLLRYGLIDPITEDVVTFEFLEDLGEIKPGTKLSFKVSGSPSARSYLPVEPVDAKVLAVDDSGRPALLRHSIGAGSTVLCTYPIEHMAAHQPSANPEGTWRLYSALASAAGVVRPVRVNDPRVIVGSLRSNSCEIVIFVNCSSDRITVEPIVTGPLQLSPGGWSTLDPFGVAAVRLEGSAAGFPRSESRKDTREEEEGGI